MATRPSPEMRGPFVGTEQIILRLQQARATSWQRRLRRAGALLGLSGTALALVWAGLHVWQPDPMAPAVRLASRAPNQNEPVLQAHFAGEQALPGEVEAPRAAPKVPSEPPRAPDRNAGVDPSRQSAVRIEVAGGPGTIFVDGVRMAMGQSLEVTLSHGEHTVMVRTQGRSMRYRLRLARAGVRLVFDGQAQRIRESAYTPPHAGR